MNNQEILTALEWRYAVKKFDPSKKISAHDWELLEASLLLTPSSYGLQPWKFILIESSEVRKQLTPISRGQSQVQDCSHFVVIAARKNLTLEYIDKHIQRIAEVRGVSLDSLQAYRKGAIDSLIHGPRKDTIGFWAQRQSFIAMGFLMETAALMKIDTCPMEGIEPLKYDEVLQLQNTEYATLAAVACGYRHQEDKYQTLKKVRFNKSDIFERR